MHKGVSTLIAAIFIIFLLVAMLASLTMVMHYWYTTTSKAIHKVEMASEKASESLKVVNGPTVTTNSITLEVQNDGSTYVLLTKYYVRDLQTDETTYGDLHTYIPVGGEETIVINGTFNPDHNYTIILVSSRYKKYISNYPQITKPVAGANLTYSIIYAPEVLSRYTVATIGYNSTQSDPTPYDTSNVLTGEKISDNPLTINSTYVQQPKYIKYGDWNYYRVVNLTEETGSDLNNYTVKVVLNSTNFNFSNAKSDGSDLIFIEPGYNDDDPLPMWIEEWNLSTDEAIIWVKVPYLKGGSTNTVIMLYGNPNYDNRGMTYYGLTKVMETLPANDGSNYRIQYEEWIMPWNNFSEIGTPQGWHGDDEAWEYPLPFTFPFYNDNITTIYICSNGFISKEYMTDWSNSEDGLKSNEMIAPFWEDLTTWDPHDIFIDGNYKDVFGNGVAIRWYANFYPGYGVANFTSVLYSNGLIRFDYGDVNGIGSDRPTVGISLGDNLHYTISSYSGEKADSFNYTHSVMFWPRKVASVEPSVSIGAENLNTVYKFVASLLLGWTLSKPSEVLHLYLDTSLHFLNGTSSYDLIVEENSSGVWSYLASYTDSLPSIIPVNKLFSGEGVGFMLNVSSDEPFEFTVSSAEIDFRVIDFSRPLIAVATNDTEGVKMWVFNPVTMSWVSVDLGAKLFNPALAFDYANMSFLLIGNDTLFSYDPFTGGVYELFHVAQNSSTSAVAISIYNGSRWLVYSPGGGGNAVYVYRLEDGALMGSYSFPEGLSEYTCSSYDHLEKYGYIIVGGSGHIYKLGISSDGELSYQELDITSPTAYPVGLAYGGGYLWIIGRGGGVHRISLSTLSVEPLNVQPPYYPLSAGDRLAYYVVSGESYLLHVREDGTSEVWIIKVG